MKHLIYADNAATTQLDMDAFEAMKPYLLGEYGNASQPYSFARTARKALQESRRLIAECIGALPEEIFFTSGGTESDNWAIQLSTTQSFVRVQILRDWVIQLLIFLPLHQVQLILLNCQNGLMKRHVSYP